MTTALQFFLSTLLVCVSAGHALAQTQDCSLRAAASIPMHTQADGRVSLPVTVKNRSLNFLVDTGGVVDTISHDNAEDLQMPRHPTRNYLVGVGGAIMDNIVVADSFAIGTLKTGTFPLYEQPPSWGGMDGTLAPDILKNYDVEFDFARSQLNLIFPDHCPGKVIYWTHGLAAAVPMRVQGNGHILISVKLDGKDVMATIDTGSMTSFISMRVARALGLDEADPRMKLEGHWLANGATRREYSYPFDTLDFEGVGVRNPDILIFPDSDLRGLDVDLVLGMDILRRLHLYIAYKEKTLYVTPALAK